MTKEIKGVVTSGTGRGAKFIALPIYSNIFENKLGDPPFHGTLNLQLGKEDAEYVTNKFENGDVHEDLTYEGKEYGGIVTIPVEIYINGSTINGVGVRPHLTDHNNTVLEIVATEHLRQLLSLEDDDILKVKV